MGSTASVKEAHRPYRCTSQARDRRTVGGSTQPRLEWQIGGGERAQAGGAEAVCWQLMVDWDGWQLRVRWWALQGAGWKLRF
jgi:hypothetical protein